MAAKCQVMSKMKIITLSIIAIIVIGVILLYYAVPNEDEAVIYKTVKLRSKDGQSSLYIKKKIWGMTSNGQQIIISDSDDKKFEADSFNHYIFNGLIPFFYKLENDTLTVYTRQVSSIPQNLRTKFSIVQFELENPDMMRLIENDNYKKQGLKEIE